MRKICVRKAYPYKNVYIFNAKLRGSLVLMSVVCFFFLVVYGYHIVKIDVRYIFSSFNEMKFCEYFWICDILKPQKPYAQFVMLWTFSFKMDQMEIYRVNMLCVKDNTGQGLLQFNFFQKTEDIQPNKHYTHTHKHSSHTTIRIPLHRR